VQRKSVFLSVVAILVLVGLGYSTWHFVMERNARSCRACMRPVHSHMKTVAIVEGKRAVYCCPACALSEHQQSGQLVQVVELTDYLDNSPLKPDGSFVVRNGDVNPCLQHQPAVGENQRDEWRCRGCGWEPDVVRDCRIAGIEAPPADVVLDELRRAKNAGERHLHADHVLPIATRPGLRLDLDNVQTLCSLCHARKTMAERRAPAMVGGDR
jgi:hypothetical protein